MPLWYNQCSYACSHPRLQLIDCWVALLASLLDSISPALWIRKAIDLDKPLTFSSHLLQPAGSHGRSRGGWRVCSPDAASLPAGCVPLPYVCSQRGFVHTALHDGILVTALSPPPTPDLLLISFESLIPNSLNYLKLCELFTFCWEPDKDIFSFLLLLYFSGYHLVFL